MSEKKPDLLALREGLPEAATLADPTKQAEAYAEAILLTIRDQQRRIEIADAENSRLRALVDSECRRAENAHAMTLRQSLVIEKMRQALAEWLAATNVDQAMAARIKSQAILAKTETDQ